MRRSHNLEGVAPCEESVAFSDRVQGADCGAVVGAVGGTWNGIRLAELLARYAPPGGLGRGVGLRADPSTHPNQHRIRPLLRVDAARRTARRGGRVPCM